MTLAQTPAQSPAQTPDAALLRRAVFASALGNAMEWFDFGVYNYLAVTIGRVFFPAQNPAAQQLAALATFAAAFLARPVGAAVFGPLGDRIGRQRVLSATMLLMACGTFCIGLIPPHHRIGLAAPAALLAARMVQGFSAGGEYGGAMIFIAEYAPEHRRGYLGSWLEFGTCAGFLAGAGMAWVLTTWLTPAALDGWGWRIPFLLAAPAGLIGVYIRVRLQETPAFRQMQREPALPEPWPWRRALLCVALVVAFNVPDFILLSFMPNYLVNSLGLAESVSLLLSVAVLVVMMALVPLAGRLADRIGRRQMVMACSTAFLLLPLPCFHLIGRGSKAAIFAGVMAMAVALAGYIGTMPSTLPTLFPIRLRYGFLAIAYNLAISLFGGTSLPIVAWLIQRTGDTLMPAYYLILTGGIGLLAGCCLPPRRRMA